VTEAVTIDGSGTSELTFSLPLTDPE
jgi:hypothetical protein